MSSEVMAASRERSLAAHVGPGFGGFPADRIHVVGVLIGEGVGPEVVPVALRLLSVLQAHTARRFDIRFGGEIGCPAKAATGRSLSPAVEQFAGEVFAERGALFCGPGGDRFVYELRRAFGLFCKFTPLRPLPELRHAGVVREVATAGSDIIAVRENLGGVYQGDWSTETDEVGRTTAWHRFGYDEETVDRILAVALRLAAGRRRRLHLVLKPAGVPSISRLWSERAEAAAGGFGVELFEVEVDNAVYQLIANPAQFDVILSPNMFGDVIADCGALLLASRGLSYSGNFDEAGHGAYQTGHGAARDIAGKGVANPIGQILALAMMLRESFDWPAADEALRAAVSLTLQDGWRTADVATAGHTVLGVEAFGVRIEERLASLLEGRMI